MKRMIYYIVFALWWLLSLLPLGVLYRLSDGMYFLLYYIIRYRRRLVRKNLCDSFPEKTGSEVVNIEKKFYGWFCDYIIETVKLMSISEKQLKRRMRFENTELVNRYAEEGRACAVYLGHYCNWEWITSLPLWVGHSAVCGQIYHVLENPAFDALLLKLRSRFGSTCIPMGDTLRRIVKWRSEGKSFVIGFIADQTPFWNNIHYWTRFLNHEKTAVFTGAERIARKGNFAVFYLDIHMERRGYYVARFKLLTDTPADTSEYEITEMATRELEVSIVRQPHLWLWTHNRWKRTYEKWLRRMGTVNHK